MVQRHRSLTKRKVNFYLDKIQDKNQETRIYLVFNFNNQRVKLGTDFFIKPKDWDKKSQRPKPEIQDQNSNVISIALDEWSLACKKAFATNYQPNMIGKEFKEILEIALGLKEPKKDKNLPPTLLNYIFETYLPQASNRVTPSTLKGLKVTANRLKEFINSEYGKDCEFNKIDWNFKEAFLDHLNESTEEGVKVSYANKSLARIKAILNESAELHNIKIHNSRKWLLKKKTDRPTPIYLTIPEIEALANLDLQGLELKARDLFLMGLFSGQRVSDYKRFKPESFVELNGNKVLKITRQQKTNTSVCIPLNLFDHWVKNITFTEVLERNNWTSPKLADQTLNRVIKNLCQSVGIDKPIINVTEGLNGIKEETRPKYKLISSHSARRSFCTNLHKLGFNLNEIASMSGHKTEKQVKEYIGVSKEEQALKLMAKATALKNQSPLRVAK